MNFASHLGSSKSLESHEVGRLRSYEEEQKGYLPPVFVERECIYT